MCGIVGAFRVKNSIIDSYTTKEILSSLYNLSLSRGIDSSGAAFKSNNTINVIRDAISANKLVKSKEFKAQLENNIDDLQLIGHARMETNGSFALDFNNQPVVKDGCIIIHNGIIVNDKEIWNNHTSLKKQFDVDTEVINSVFRENLTKDNNIINSINNTLKEVKGSYSLGILLTDYNTSIFTTNTGSLYYLKTIDNSFILIASELRFLQNIRNKYLQQHHNIIEIKQILPGEILSISRIDEKQVVNLYNNKENIPTKNFYKTNPTDVSIKNTEFSNKNIDKRIKNDDKYELISSLILKQYEISKVRQNNLKRCTKCILPETMPFITFDENGVCNYCKTYIKQTHMGLEALKKEINKYDLTKKPANCIVSFSGGRDSSYALHFASKELGLKPLAFSYDWGMLTDLGRRNQARMTGSLGVEHILVSAEIQQKREYIRKNVLAWLKKPEIGMIPLFMAGDKQYFYNLNKLRKEYNIDLVIYGDNALEKTDFKYGFADVKLASKVGKAYDIGLSKTWKLLWYYWKNYIKNPAYINSSIYDTFTAYYSSYFVPKDYTYLFRYIKWEEKTIEDTLINQYEWETSPDTKSTWRIGDGTASFYNYIYYVLAGVTENDTFRSNQIRENMITRQEALIKADTDNIPRIESIIWYCNTIGIDAIETINIINKASNNERN